MLPGNFDCKIRIKGAAAGKGAKDQKDRKQQRSCRCSCSTRISLLRTNFKKLFRVPIRLYSLTQPASSPAHQGPPVDFEWLLGVFNLLQCRQGDIIILHIQPFNCRQLMSFGLHWNSNQSCSLGYLHWKCILPALIWFINLIFPFLAST